MRELMTIGELAKLFNIKTTKIRFYERKGLLDPARIQDSEYRLYSFDELDKLELILLLREMGVSLEKITTMTKGYKQADYKKLLLDLKKETIIKIKELKSKIKMLDNRISHLTSFEENQLIIVERPVRYYVEIEKNINDSFTEKVFYDNHNKYNLKLSNYEDKYVFVFNNDFTLNKGVDSPNKTLKGLARKKIPKGKYIEMRMKGSFFTSIREGIAKVYHSLEESGYEVEGPIYSFEDYRLFLFSNQTGYYTCEAKLKTKTVTID